MNILQLKEIVKQTLTEKRYYHSICVMEKCEELAEIYGINKEMAQKVGLVHDIAKEMTDEEKFIYAKKNNINIDLVERKHIGLLHAKIGADIAKKEFSFTEEMCKAIRLHTTAGENMNMLDKILYVSDSIGKDRTWDDVEFVNKLAKEKIDDAVIYLLNIEIKDRIDKKKMLHIDSILAWNELINK